MHKGNFYVYILASKRNGTLYIGVTSNLQKRIFQHKENVIKGFTEKYGIHLLVHYEVFYEISVAIAREKQLKKWNRSWKISLIELSNPAWKNLYEEL